MLPKRTLRPRSGVVDPAPARGAQKYLGRLVSALGNRDAELVLQLLRDLVGHRAVPPADEYGCNGADVGIEIGSQTPLDSAQESLCRRAILLGTEEQGNVDRNAREDRLLDGGQTFLRAGNLDQQIRTSGPRVEISGGIRSSPACRTRAVAKPRARPSRPRCWSSRRWAGTGRLRESDPRGPARRRSARRSGLRRSGLRELVPNRDIVGGAALDGSMEFVGFEVKPLTDSSLLYRSSIPLSSSSRVRLSSQRLWPRSCSSCVAFMVAVLTVIESAAIRSAPQRWQILRLRTTLSRSWPVAALPGPHCPWQC